MKIYISGPMTGYPDLNYPAFNQLAAELRAEGYEVLNPAEIVLQDAPSYNGYMRECVKLLAEADEILMMHKWMDSDGANLEYTVARGLKLKMRYIGDEK